MDIPQVLQFLKASGSAKALNKTFDFCGKFLGVSSAKPIEKNGVRREVSEAELLAEVQAADSADAAPADAADAASAEAAAPAAAAPAAAAPAAAAPAAASPKADGQWWHVGIGCSRCIHRLIIPHDPHRPPPHLR